MGITTSKSPLERRNTVARRSQRRLIHGLKSKVDKISQDINKFRGIEEDEKYQQLSRELNRIRNELKNRLRDLQPQVRNIYQTTLNKLEEASEALQNKVLENQEKARKKEAELQEKQKQKEEKSKKKAKTKDEDDDIEVTEVQENEKDEDDEDNEQNDEHETHEKSQLENSTEKRQTVELKFIKVIPESTIEAEVPPAVSSPKLKSAEEKRKSILKLGVPVMPGVMSGMSTKKISIVSPEDELKPTNGNSNNLLDRITDINEQLEAIEYQIADFVGKRNGTQYSRIRNKLISYLTEVDEINTNDNYNIEQITLCKNYIGSCLNFLDEKAVDSHKVIEEEGVAKNEEAPKNNDAGKITDAVENNNTLQDDVFLLGNNNVLSQHEVNLKLQKLTRTTAI